MQIEVSQDKQQLRFTAILHRKTKVVWKNSAKQLGVSLVMCGGTWMFRSEGFVAAHSWRRVLHGTLFYEPFRKTVPLWRR